MRHWMLSAAVLSGAFLLPALAGGAPAIADDTATQQAPLKSAKERLSDKASDEQRVDNCRVPPDRRGSKPRPDCPPAQAGGPNPSDNAAVSR
jgi:hypothetical protein